MSLADDGHDMRFIEQFLLLLLFPLNLLENVKSPGLLPPLPLLIVIREWAKISCFNAPIPAGLIPNCIVMHFAITFL